MSDVDKHAERLGAQLEVKWTDDRVEEGLVRLHARRRARRLGAAAGVGIAAVVLVVAAVVANSGSAPARRLATPAPSSPSAAPIPAPQVQATAPVGPSAPLALGDGSVVTPLDAETRLETGEISPGAVTIRLRAGSARFKVEHRDSRVFRVVSGEVSIVDMGTEFTVTRDQDTTVVEVLGGSVRVEWRGGTAEMVAGERRVFPPAEPTNVKLAPARVVVAPRAPAAAPAPEEDVEALLALADESRLRGDPAAAVAPLTRVIDQHADDPRAPLAAFTLGRVYLDELNDPGKAAAAFARARALAPAGPLAEDALAREVEARGRAGESAQARALAQQYLDDYPDGRRAVEVRRSAGLQ